MKFTRQHSDIDDGIVEVRLAGEIAIHDFRGGTLNPLEELLGSGWASQRILLDLDHVSAIDSSAIGWLITCHKKCKQAGGQLAVHSPQPAVKQILKILQIDKLMPLAENAKAGRALLADTLVK